MLHSPMLEAAGVSPGWLALAAAGVAVVAYFLGCFNGAVVVSRYILRNDIRQHGSGNAGLTNFYRVFGGPLTLMVVLSDVVKAVLAVLFAMFIAGSISPELVTLSQYWAGTFCMLGHMYPCTFQFKGGKGVLSGSAVAVMIGLWGGGALPGWIIPVVLWGGFLVLVVTTRWVSLGSCWGGASFIVLSWLVYRDPLVLLLACVMGGLLLWKHRGNMVRIVKGTESKFAFHKKDGGVAAPASERKSEPMKGLEKAEKVPKKMEKATESLEKGEQAAGPAPEAVQLPVPDPGGALSEPETPAEEPSADVPAEESAAQEEPAPEKAGKSPEGEKAPPEKGKEPPEGEKESSERGKEPPGGEKESSVRGKEPPEGEKASPERGKEPPEGEKASPVRGKEPPEGEKESSVRGKKAPEENAAPAGEAGPPQPKARKSSPRKRSKSKKQ